MEENSGLIIQSLPPILSSIGAFFVLLFFGYGKEQVQKRIMSAALLVLMIWITYLCVVMAGEKYTLFSPIITITALMISMILLMVVFYLNMTKPITSDGILITLFGLGVLSSTIGFVNYFAMSDRIVIAIREVNCDGSVSLGKELGGQIYKQRESSMFGEVGFVIYSADYEGISGIRVSCTDIDKEPKEIYGPVVRNKKSFNRLSRGAGVEYISYDYEFKHKNQL